MGNGEVINISITTNKDTGKNNKDFTTVYKRKMAISDKKALADCFISLKKYGLNLKEIIDLMEKEEIELVMYHHGN